MDVATSRDHVPLRPGSSTAADNSVLMVTEQKHTHRKAWIISAFGLCGMVLGAVVLLAVNREGAHNQSHEAPTKIATSDALRSWNPFKKKKDPPCPDGYSYSDKKCVKYASKACPEGYKSKGSKCAMPYADYAEKEEKCPYGYEQEDEEGKESIEEPQENQEGSCAKIYPVYEEYDKECPSGYKEEGEGCAKSSTSYATRAEECPYGYQEKDEKCMKMNPNYVNAMKYCPEGYEEDRKVGGCMKYVTTKKYADYEKKCPEYYKMVQGKCVKYDAAYTEKTRACPGGYDYNAKLGADNNCVKYNTDYHDYHKKCPEDYMDKASRCVKYDTEYAKKEQKCPTGYEEKDYKCVKDAYRYLDKECPQGYEPEGTNHWHFTSLRKFSGTDKCVQYKAPLPYRRL